MASNVALPDSFARLAFSSAVSSWCTRPLTRSILTIWPVFAWIVTVNRSGSGNGSEVSADDFGPEPFLSGALGLLGALSVAAISNSLLISATPSNTIVSEFLRRNRSRHHKKQNCDDPVAELF